MLYVTDSGPHRLVPTVGSKLKTCGLCHMNQIKSKLGWRIQCRFQCDVCGVPLCKGRRNCFIDYHNIMFGKSTSHGDSSSTTPTPNDGAGLHSSSLSLLPSTIESLELSTNLMPTSSSGYPAITSLIQSDNLMAQSVGHQHPVSSHDPRFNMEPTYRGDSSDKFKMVQRDGF